ncbi:MAG: hypothetical protein M1609_13110 [Firmicutes bacterium]|nr:hypothetical protein [Bacillota bacterium]
MDTISHGAWTYLLAHRYPKRWLAVLGAVFPDFAVIGVAFVMFIHGSLKLSPPWQPQLYTLPLTPLIDSVFHSLVLWTILLGVSVLLQLSNLRWFIYGVFLHIGIDIVTHKQFLPWYLFPLTRSTVSGPVDYRTLTFTVVDITLLLIAGYLLWHRYHKLR